jgi:hypothetical protein
MYEQYDGKLVHSQLMKKYRSLWYANQGKFIAQALQYFWH